MTQCKTPLKVLNRVDEKLVYFHPDEISKIVHDARLARVLEAQVAMDTECIERIRNKCAELEAQAEKDRAEIERLRVVILRAANILSGGEGVSDQGEAFDRALRLLDVEAQRPADGGTGETT